MLPRILEALATTIDLRAFVLRLLAAACMGFALAALNAWIQPPCPARMRLLRTLPLLAGSMALVTAVVTSSLAIAIGMVGAMSIVRFRTVLPEGHTLVLFMAALAMGLCAGIGAPVAGLILLPALGAWWWHSARAKPAPTRIHLRGESSGLAGILPDLQRSFPALRFQDCTLAPGRSDWTLSHPALDLPRLLALRSYLQEHAPGLHITWEHAPQA